MADLTFVGKRLVQVDLQPTLIIAGRPNLLDPAGDRQAVLGRSRSRLSPGWAGKRTVSWVLEHREARRRSAATRYPPGQHHVTFGPARWGRLVVWPGSRQRAP